MSWHLSATRLAIWVSAVLTSAAASGAPVQEPVSFKSGPVTLAGTLFHPADERTHPAIVLLHGSGDGPRARLVPLAERFVNNGYAALVFDKRGSGESSGAWTASSLDDLASDALAATAFLRTRRGVDPTRVGAWAISQGGWVLARAMARDPQAIAFAIFVSGGALKPVDIERYDYRTALERAGISGRERADALALIDRYLEYLRTGRDRSGLDRALGRARGTRWFSLVDLSKVLPSAEARAQWRWVSEYDPADDLRRIDVPTLVVLGGRDRPTLAGAMAASWRRAFAASGNRRASIVELEGADHGGTIEGTHHQGADQAFVPEYLEMMDAWMRTLTATSSH